MSSTGAASVLPVVAVVGRPNVGKSTLVNRIAGKQIAIVEAEPGITRDRLELECEWNGVPFLLVDTGGVVERGDALDNKVTEQSIRALQSADVVLFVLDTTTGIAGEDPAVAGLVRRAKRPTIVVANKVDSERREVDAWEFAGLGLGPPTMVSALHGRGVGDLLDDVVALFGSREAGDRTGDESAEAPAQPVEARLGGAPAADAIAAVAIVGRPNVGKSTLFNRLAGEDRSVVHDMPGTTRDAIDTVIETDHGALRLVDTAGMRRRAKSGEGPEYYSLVRALRALDRSDVALLVLDATEGVTHQDQRLAERIDASGSPVVILLNKWDLLGTEDRLEVGEAVADRLAFLGYAPDAAPVGLDGARRAPPAAGRTRRHRRLPPTDPDGSAERRPARRAGGPSGAGRRPYPLRGARCRRPTDRHAVRHPAAPADLPALPRALAAGALRARPDADRPAGAHPPAAMSTEVPVPQGAGDDAVVRIAAAGARAIEGNLAKGAETLRKRNKLFVRDRISLLCEEGSFVEEGLLANALASDLPADGVVVGQGRVDGRPVCVMANDPTVKAGSWGARTVEKIVRLTEHALAHELPVFYLVDSAGARITDQVELFPGRRGAGRIFYNEVRLSGRVPQICCLFGPSAAGGAYIPAFCDVVFMVEGNASMYLGSPRMAEMVVGEITTLEEMGGARMHATVSGCGDNLVPDDATAIEEARAYFSYLPGSWREAAPFSDPAPAARLLDGSVIPATDTAGYDVHDVIDAVVDEHSFFELKPLFAPELVIGWGRLEGRSIGIVANNPLHKGGVLFGDSADKAARFIWCADAFNIPLLFLADVPGFMIGTQVEREGIIRHGAKMITAVSEATVPKISVILRKAYGAGLYAMSGPAFEPDACLALPTARIAVMGPEAAVNAVYANHIAAIDDGDEREAFVNERRREYELDVDLLRLAADLVIDAVVKPEDLRLEVAQRLAMVVTKSRRFSERHHGVPPV